MTPYQLFLLTIMFLWPIIIIGILWFMSRLEDYVNRSEADTPAEAGLEPVAGAGAEREVRIVLGDRVIGEPEHSGPAGSHG